jgi:hypothetical protein
MTSSLSAEALVTTFATAKAQADAERTGGNCAWVPPTTPKIVEVFACGSKTKVWFVFDFLVHHGTQSGSDWNYHFVYVGTVTIERDAIVDSKLEQRCETHVTEFEYEWAPEGQRYDCGRVLEEERASWWKEVQAARTEAADMP